MLPVMHNKHGLTKQLVGLFISFAMLATYYRIASHYLCGGNAQELLLIQHTQLQQAVAAVTSQQSPTEKVESRDFRVPPGPPGDGRSTVIVTSNLIPSHPSLWMINETITSIPQHLIGLEPDFQLVLAVDGPKRGTKGPDRKRFRAYVAALENTCPHANFRVTWKSAGLTRNVLVGAIQNVSTEFVYLMQHDMPFCCHPIDHTSLIQAARATNGYPFNVRFNKIQNIPVGINRGKCWASATPLSRYEALEFTKTPSWSDK